MSNYSVRTGNMFAQIGGASAPIKKVKGEGKTKSAEKRAKKKKAEASTAPLPVGNGLSIPSAASDPPSASELRGAYQAVTEDLAPEDDHGFEDIKRRERKEKDVNAVVEQPKKKQTGSNRKDRPATADTNGASNGEAKRIPKSALKGLSPLVKQLLEATPEYSIDEVLAAESSLRRSGATDITGTTLLAAIQAAQMAALLTQSSKPSSVATPTTTTTRDDGAARSARAPLSARAPILGSNTAATIIADTPSLAPVAIAAAQDSKRSARAPKVAKAASSSVTAAAAAAAAPTPTPTPAPVVVAAVPSFVAPTIEPVSWQAELAAERETDSLPSIASLEQKASLWDPQSADSSELLEYWASQLERSARNDGSFITQFVQSNALEVIVTRLFTNLWLPKSSSATPRKIQLAILRIFVHTMPVGADWHNQLWTLLLKLVTPLRNASSRDSLLSQIIKGISHQKRARIDQGPLESLIHDRSLATTSAGGRDTKSAEFVPAMDLGLTSVSADFFGDATSGPNSLKARCDALVQSSNRIQTAGTRVNQYARVLEKQKWQHKLQMDFHLLEKDIQSTIDNTTRHLDATNERSSQTASQLSNTNDSKRTALSAYGDKEFKDKHSELVHRRAQLQAELTRVQSDIDALVARHERSRTQHDQLTHEYEQSTSQLESKLSQYRAQTTSFRNDCEAAGAIHHHVVSVYEHLTTMLTSNIKRASAQSFKSLADYIVQVREHVIQVHDVYQGLQGRMQYCKEKLDAADAEAKRLRTLHLPVPSFKESFATIYQQDRVIVTRMEKQVMTLFEYIVNLIAKAEATQQQSLLLELDGMIKKFENKSVTFDLLKLRVAYENLAAMSMQSLSSSAAAAAATSIPAVAVSAVPSPFASSSSSRAPVPAKVPVRAAPVVATAAAPTPFVSAKTPIIPAKVAAAAAAVPVVPSAATNGRAPAAATVVVAPVVPVKVAAKVAAAPIIKGTVFAPVGLQVSSKVPLVRSTVDTPASATSPPIISRNVPVVPAKAAKAAAVERTIVVPSQPKKSWDPVSKPANVARIRGADSDDDVEDVVPAKTAATVVAAAAAAAASATPKTKRNGPKPKAAIKGAATSSAASTAVATPAATPVTNEFPSLPAATTSATVAATPVATAVAAAPVVAPVVVAVAPVAEVKAAEPVVAAAAPVVVAAPPVVVAQEEVVADEEEVKEETATTEEASTEATEETATTDDATTEAADTTTAVVEEETKTDDKSEEATTGATPAATSEAPAVATDAKEDVTATSVATDDTNGDADEPTDAATVAEASLSPKGKRTKRKARKGK